MRRTAGSVVSKNIIVLHFSTFHFSFLVLNLSAGASVGGFVCDDNDDYHWLLVVDDDDETQKEESPPNLLLHN